MRDPITRFREEYFFLSNFYHVFISLGGRIYPSVEHAYQASKTFHPLERIAILEAKTAPQAKRLGKHLAHMRSDWDNVKLKVMRELLEQKFSTEHKTLREKLIATGDAEIVEGNNWGDTFWGVCGGEGENHLGRMLMEIRDSIR